MIGRAAARRRVGRRRGRAGRSSRATITSVVLRALVCSLKIAQIRAFDDIKLSLVTAKIRAGSNQQTLHVLDVLLELRFEVITQPLLENRAFNSMANAICRA